MENRNYVNEDKSNTIKVKYPKIFEQISDKNYIFNIENLTIGSSRKILWKCENGHDYLMSIKDKINKNCNCPYCNKGKLLIGFNDIETKSKEYLANWDYNKNKENPKEIYYLSMKKFYWKCDLGHSYIMTAYDKILKNRNCPYCNGKKVLFGFNDVYTKRPDLRKYFVNIEDSKKVSPFSNKQVEVKCDICGEKRKILVSYLSMSGLSCKKCGNTISISQKIMYNLLDSLNKDFVSEKTFEWSNGKRYDFYLKDYNCIIETNGSQHYENHNFGYKTLQEEQENDKYKERLAKENGIKYYIVLDCRKSELEWIKNSILNSELNKLFNLSNVDWDKLFIISQQSNPIIKKCCRSWNEGNTTKEIMKKVGISHNTVAKYLKIGTKMGICNYVKEEQLKRRGKGKSNERDKI